MKRNKRIEHDELIDLGIHSINLLKTYQSICDSKKGYEVTTNARKDLIAAYDQEKLSAVAKEYKFMLFMANEPSYAAELSPKKFFKLRGGLCIAPTLAFIELNARKAFDAYPILRHWCRLISDTGILWFNGVFIGLDDSMDYIERSGKLYWQETK